jgi:hypothetical protein
MSEVTEEERNRINNERVERLKNSKFKQQMLPAWRPVPTYPFTMTIFIVFGIVFLTLGIVIYAMSNKVQQVIIPYSSECGDQVSCTLEFKIEEDIEGPLYTYYELTNFYQNHRRYVKSRSYTQLMGDEIDGSQANKDCDPIITNKDMGVTESVDGTALDETAIAYPCGLIAKSVFTDAYRVLAVKGDANSELPIDDSDIAWKSDVEFKFKNQAGDWKKTQWLDVTNRKYSEHRDLFRALYRVDENCGPAKLPQALRQPEGRIEKRYLLLADRKYIRC